jgi:hypothetical protein
LVLNVREKLTKLAESHVDFKAILALLETSQVLALEAKDEGKMAMISFDTRRAKAELLAALQLCQNNLGNHLLTLTVLLFLLDLFKISGDISQQYSFKKAVSGLAKKIEFGIMDGWISKALESFAN